MPAPAPSAAVAAPAKSPGGSAPVVTEDGIAWELGDVDAAFARAKAANKPVFLYWGAVWCPPCNQVKATIFNRQDFIERSRFFVPVYLDGDSKSAQKLGARFKVGGYPTMILFTPDGTEITRLPGEVDADQYMRVLAMGMNGARPVKATLAAALASRRGDGEAKLTPEDWRMLAYYSWATDEQTLVPKDAVAATLRRLARACPADQPATATRLALSATAAAATAKGAKPHDDKAAREHAVKVLADAKLARENFDLLAYAAPEIVGQISLPKSAERAALAAAWDAALQRFAADTRLSATDRLSAVGARVDLARLDCAQGCTSRAVAGRRARARRAGRKGDNRPLRARDRDQRRRPRAGGGRPHRSSRDALLEAELARSATPYYFMLGLASNARKRGDKAGAVAWAEKAYTTASGPATRLQWGAGYVGILIDLTPDDAARIEQAAIQVIGELEPVPDTFYDRNRRSLERMTRKLAAWNKDKPHQEALQRIRAELAGVCARLPAGDPGRAACSGVWNPPKSAA